MSTGWFERLRGTVALRLPETIVVEHDWPYGSHAAQRMDLYRPRRPVGLLPVLVLVHGGAWSMGDKARPEFITNKVLHWVQRGWVVVSLNYRMLPLASAIQQAADIALALAVVQKQVGDRGGDDTSIFLLGHSSGAHLGALVLADRVLGAQFELKPLQGAVLVDGAAYDVVRIMQGRPLPLHARAFGTESHEWPAASPWHRLGGTMPPQLLLCSELRSDGVEQNQAFASRIRDFGGAARVLTLPLNHAEMNRQLGLPGALTEAVDAFLDETCKRAHAPGC